MGFDWGYLKSFLAVAEEESLSAAGRRLALSQPTVGRQIQGLEAALDLKLFARVGRRLTLTEAGADLLGPAREMAEAADRFALAAAGREESLAGVVRITASEVMSTFVLPPIFVALRDRAPEIEIELVSSNTTGNLLTREADIAVRMYRPTQMDVITRHIRDFELATYAAHTYLERFGEPKRPDDLLDHLVVGYDRDELLLRGFQALGYSVTRRFFPFRTDDQVVLWRMVVEGYGVGFVPRAVGDDEPKVRRILPELPLPTLPVWLTAHAELRTNRRIRRVYDFLAAEL